MDVCDAAEPRLSSERSGKRREVKANASSAGANELWDAASQGRGAPCVFLASDEYYTR